MSSDASATRRLNDMEGWVHIRRRFLSKRRHQYVRLNGSHITIHSSENTPIEWDASLLHTTLDFFPRRSCVLITLTSGSKIYLQPDLRHTYHQWVSALQIAATRQFEHHYDLQDKIGEGAFASVHRAKRKLDGAVFAVKQIKKKQFDMQMARELEREMYAMRHVNHPALINAHDVFNTPERVLIVMNYMRGGTLKENVQQNGGKISENDALPIIRQVLDACTYLHSAGYVHRDLKLENILCDEERIAGASIRIADFGYVNFIANQRDNCLRSLVGTPVYVAPEIINRRVYGAPVDVYAVGIMLHRMLVGNYPYDAKDDERTMSLAVKGGIRLEGKHWQHISSLCKSFILALLQPNPDRRITAAAALQHRWMKSIHLEGVADKQQPVVPTGSESPAMMSPVTPDLSLAAKTSQGEHKLQVPRHDLQLHSAGLRLRDIDPISSASEKTLSSRRPRSSVFSSQCASRAPCERKGGQWRGKLRNVILVVTFVTKLRLASGVCRSAPPKRVMLASVEGQKASEVGLWLAEGRGSRKKTLSTLNLSNRLQQTFCRRALRPTDNISVFGS